MSDVFLESGVKVAGVKLGSLGCFIKTAEERHMIPAYNIGKRNVRDTTGGGDSFIAGFLAGYARELPLEECGRLGNAVGAICVSGIGASTAIIALTESGEPLGGKLREPSERILDFIRQQSQSGLERLSPEGLTAARKRQKT